MAIGSGGSVVWYSLIQYGKWGYLPSHARAIWQMQINGAHEQGGRKLVPKGSVLPYSKNNCNI